ncbi:MAG: VOC family protein [Geodermatophilaceae bacterium]|jgi:predicted lactoylglutathione lyase|nr:VOC family protein [Geodermatophilaceae bacterium]
MGDMTVPARISIVTLGVADLPRATAFYRALGWEPTPYSTDEITFIDTAGSMLALFPTDALAADAHLDPPPSTGFRGVTLAINLGSDDEVRSVLADAEAAGATVVKPATPSPFFDGLDGYFTDPDGHAWEVAHNPDLLPASSS